MFFGGARGGGKTDGVLGKWAIKESRYGRHFNAIMLRRTAVSAEDAIERSKEIFGPLGGKFNESKLRWRMPNGGRVNFGYLDNVEDANEYQGRNVTDAWIEEAGQYPSSGPIDRLFGVLRSAAGVPVQMILTANPGGGGQHWIRQRYNLVPFPAGPKLLTRTLSDGSIHKFAVIPSRIGDNRLLLHRDPGYVSRLHLVGSPQLIKGWLDGDWTAIEGAFFECWSEAQHVVQPFAVPKEWSRFRSGDWGSASPFSIGWWAIVREEHKLHDGRELPVGALVRYREWYGASGPNTGLKLTAEAVAQGIVKREKDDPALTAAVLDPSAFKEDGGPSIGERINGVLTKEGRTPFRGADNSRVAKRGAMGGWDQVRARLVGTNGVPMLYCFATCRDSIRTIPVLQHDMNNAEDLDTTSEDHAADEWRYACMSRPWQAKLKSMEPDTRDAYRSAHDEFDEMSGFDKSL